MPRLLPLRRLLAPLLAAMMVLAACSSGDGSPDAPTAAGSNAPRPEKDNDAKGGGDNDAGEDGVAGAKKACPPPGDRSGELSAEAAVLQNGGEDGPGVEAVVYPHPDYEGRPWSQWGQGLALSDGRFISAIGDQCGINGDAYLYEFDSESGELSLATDVLSLVELEPGAWGYGKIHAQMVAGPGGDVYATTYWGSQDGLVYDQGYEGDRLLRRDAETGEWEDLGVPVPEHGIPSLAGYVGLVYGEAVDPTADGKAGKFFVYDTDAGEVIFEADKGDTKGYRNVLVDAGGRAYFSVGEGVLEVYDPDTNEATELEDRLPGEWLRASSRPAPDGTVYGVTREPDTLFALRPSGQIDEMGPVRGYVASIALSPDGERLYYVPDAHGTSWEQGTPLVAVDTETGDEEVVVELNELAEDELGLRLGGSYDVAVDPGGDRVYVGLNANTPSSGSTFGEVVLAVVDLG